MSLDGYAVVTRRRRPVPILAGGGRLFYCRMECVVQNSDRLTAKNVRHCVTRIFIDDFVYEPLLVERADFAKYAKSSDALDILRTGEKKHAQEHFKTTVPGTVIRIMGRPQGRTPTAARSVRFISGKKKNLSGANPLRNIWFRR
jgi:hypothetical protein